MRTSRRIVWAVFCLAALLSVTGCAKDPGMSNGDLSKSGGQPSGTGGTGGANTGGQGAASGTLDLGTMKMGQTANFKGLTYTLQEVEVDKSGPNLSPASVYVFVHFVIKNGTKASVLVNSLNCFKLADPSGNRFGKSIYADRVKGDPLDGYVKPGETMDGWMGFQAKPAAGDFNLEVTPYDGAKVAYKIQVAA